jgi:hypothetical protein
VPDNAENMFLILKERRPFKLKKEYPSEQWQIKSFRLIPLKTPVSFHWTVPLRWVKTWAIKQSLILKKSVNMAAHITTDAPT